MGLFSSDKKLAETKYAGRESASQKAARKAAEKQSRQSAQNPQADDPMGIYEAVRNTPESKARRNPITRALSARESASEIPDQWNR